MPESTSMDTTVLANISRFLGLVLLQGLVFQSIGTDLDFRYLHVIVYPIFLLLLPMRIPVALVILLGFLIGFFVDMMYGTWGIHASASVFTAYIRSFIFKILEPRGGYNVNLSPTAANLGSRWFFQYAAIMLLLHLFFYFSVEAFTFVYIVDILLKTFVSFIVSMLFLTGFQLIFDPKV
ncbi:MAG TPA: hypothetical protein ENJ20_02935 [Bacteroidetes bacterium]|nr:hypothetical protein [Bacteroidota bacterium]